jgi:hypothetical protein
MPTLGDRLRYFNAEVERKAAEKIRLDREANEAANIKHISAIRTKFEEFKTDIINNIDLGVAIPEIRPPDSWVSYKNESFNIDNTQHFYNYLWNEFSEWAASEGLSVTLIYEHDGMGMRSWYVLRVVPA